MQGLPENISTLDKKECKDSPQFQPHQEWQQLSHDMISLLQPSEA